MHGTHTQRARRRVKQRICHFFPNWCRCFWPFPFRLFAGNFQTDTLAFFSAVPGPSSQPTSQRVKATMEMIIEENAKQTTTHTNNKMPTNSTKNVNKCEMNAARDARKKCFERKPESKNVKNYTEFAFFLFFFYLLCAVCALARKREKEKWD